jgi:hypothetical protein
MSGELVKLALAGAAASVLIWALSFLAPHCVPEHVWASDSARGVLEIDIPRHHVSLCQLLAPRPPAGAVLLHEIKHDGFRVIARKGWATRAALQPSRQ